MKVEEKRERRISRWREEQGEGERERRVRRWRDEWGERKKQSGGRGDEGMNGGRGRNRAAGEGMEG